MQFFIDSFFLLATSYSHTLLCMCVCMYARCTGAHSLQWCHIKLHNTVYAFLVLIWVKKLKHFPTYICRYVLYVCIFRAAFCCVDRTDSAIVVASMRQQKIKQLQQQWWQKSCALPLCTHAAPAGQLMNHVAAVPPWRMSDVPAT